MAAGLPGRRCGGSRDARARPVAMAAEEAAAVDVLFVYAGRGYALPKVESFIQTALELVDRDRRPTRELVR